MNVQPIPKIPKQKPYSVTDKLAVIPNVKHTESQASLSCDNGVPESTIHGWLRHEEKLYNLVGNPSDFDVSKGWLHHF